MKNVQGLQEFQDGPAAKKFKGETQIKVVTPGVNPEMGDYDDNVNQD